MMTVLMFELRLLHQWMVLGWLACIGITCAYAVLRNKPGVGMVACMVGLFGLLFVIFPFGLWWIGSGHADR